MQFISSYPVHVPKDVSEPLLEELSRARINRPALLRSLSTLGYWMKGVMETAEKERVRAELEQWRRKATQTELLRLRESLRGTTCEPHASQAGAQPLKISPTMSPEECQLLASALYARVTSELDPPGLQEQFDDVEAQAGGGGH